MKKLLTFALIAFVCLSASAEAGLLVYEPFDYPDGLLNGQGGALGTTGTWTTNDTGFAEGWWCHPEGELTGQYDDIGEGLNMFDGTLDNLPTSGGFVGSAGPEEQGSAFGTRDPTGNMDANIGLDPSVTATFLSGTTTWFSYVGAHADNRNQGSPSFMISTDPTANGSRGVTMENSGNGIGGVGGPPRFNLHDVYPHYFSGGIHHQTPGGYLGGVFGGHDGIVTGFCSTGTCDGVLDESGQPRTQTKAWQISDENGFGAANIIVGKIEWDADTGGEDIISVVSFLEPNDLSEAAFDALVAALPPLSSANWASNKPNLDQSQFDTLNISSLKFYVDEIRIGTTFEDVTGGTVDPVLPEVDAGPDMITWTGKTVTLDPNVVNHDVTALTFAWTADDPIAVFDPPSADVEKPDVTIIKPTSVTTAITLINPGFELPAQDDGDYTSNFDDCPGWSDIDVISGGVWDPGLGGTKFPGYGGIAPEGENVAYVTNSGIEQVLTKTVAADTTYTLTVEVGNSIGAISSWTGYTVQLLAGGNLVGEDDNTVTIASETFETSTVEYSSGADAEADPNVGQALQIRLLTNGSGEANFDDVKLSTLGPAPNPYSVRLTLAVKNEGKPVEDTRKDSMRIYVYDDACEAARVGKGLAAENPGDFNGNCITDPNDLATLASKWLTGDALTAPVIKP